MIRLDDSLIDKIEFYRRGRLSVVWRPSRPRRGRWVIWMGYEAASHGEAVSVAYARTRVQAIRVGRDWVIG
jgi:hypothetical protein